jgi:hypothetical protein
MDESGIRKNISSLRGYIAGEFPNLVATGLGAVSIAPQIGMSPLMGALGVAGITFAVKYVLSPKARTTSHPLTYVSSVRKEL